MRKSVLAFIILLLLCTACQETDVVANYSISSFSKVLQNVSHDFNEGNFTLYSPDGLGKFIWGKSVALEIAIKPFLDAGLDISKLPEEIPVKDDKIIVYLENAANVQSEDPSEVFESVIRKNRDSLSYHSALDHFGINFPGEHSFEWSKDMISNDKDLVFALNPMPFKDAGADIENIPGWTLTEVEMMEMGGKTTHMKKLIKAFDL